jgi:hypothetical protein
VCHHLSDVSRHEIGMVEGRTAEQTEQTCHKKGESDITPSHVVGV